MFRFAPYKDNHTLTDVQIRVNIGLKVAVDGNAEYRYYDLDLERSRVESLPMNWTVVHPLDAKSPLLGFSWEDMQTADVELYILIRGIRRHLFQLCPGPDLLYLSRRSNSTGNSCPCTGKAKTEKPPSWSSIN